MKRIICLGAILLVGAAGVFSYTYFLDNQDDLPLLEPPKTSVESAVEVLSPITFSCPDTFYATTIDVELNGGENSEIYYTLDGSVPTKESKKYDKPIEVACKSKVTSTTIKAIAVTEEGVSDVVTKSYVTGKTVFTRFDENTLVFVLSADPYDLYDYENGICVEGKIRDEWIENEYDGYSEILPIDPANWNQEGMAGEREMYVEVFDSAGNKLLEQAAGARVSGAYSRSVDQKSWKLISRRIYSPDNGTFHYSFFDDATDANGALLTEYDRITLRNNANDREFASIRDEVSLELSKQAGFPDTQATRPAAVFLNGKYYGFSWMHQTYCNGYLESVYGGNKDNYQIVGGIESHVEGDTKEAGDSFNRLSQLAKEGLVDEERFEEFCSIVDIDNLIMYYAIQIYIDNRDWPGNNYKAWRYVPSEGEEITSPNLDGKWRYLLFDVEFAWGLYSDGYRNMTIRKLLNGSHPAGGSAFLNALVERDDMKQKLSNTLCDLISGAFSPENAKAVIESKIAECDVECMYALNNGITSTWANEKTFADSRNEVLQFAKNRYNIVYKDMISSFSITDTDMYTISLENSTGANTYLNSQNVTTAKTITGTYFKEYSVPISVSAYSGYELDYIEINGKKYTDTKVEIKPDIADSEGKISVKVVMKKTISDVPLFVSEVYTSGNADWIELYNPNTVSISTRDFYLSDDVNVLNKWKIPTVTIAPESTLVIVCKNNKDSSALMKLQTNFSLKEGEVLTLSDNHGKILSRVQIVDVGKEKSQNRQPDGSYKSTAVTSGKHKN